MVIVSHDREFLDQLCTKIVETEQGVSHSYKGNYTQYTASKAERNAQQYSAYEKQQKEITRLVCFHDPRKKPSKLVKSVLSSAVLSPTVEGSAQNSQNVGIHFVQAELSSLWGSI